MCDYKKVKEKRNQNYAILEKGLGQKNSLILKKTDGPYCYPFYCKGGLNIKKMLAEKKIYVATLWPNVLKLEGTLEKDYAENIMPLPCDQRYNKEDMKFIINCIKSCLNRERK